MVTIRALSYQIVQLIAECNAGRCHDIDVSQLGSINRTLELVADAVCDTFFTECMTAGCNDRLDHWRLAYRTEEVLVDLPDIVQGTIVHLCSTILESQTSY